MHSPASSSDTRNLDEQLHQKIKYNFKLHILLCLKGSNWNRQDILHKIYLLDGYRCHKVVRYGTNWSHIHIKFVEEQKAKDAIEFFKNLNSDLIAMLVDDLLKDFYSYELRFNYSPPWTLAIIDVVGITPQSMNFLTENLLNSVLQDFGQPYLLPYTAALPEPHVQVIFSSMTESLAACMAFGQWYRMNQKTDQFFYRVRINPCRKEALLIKNSGGFPEEAFKLDYFINARHKINISDCFNKKNSTYQTTWKNSVSSQVYNKEQKTDVPGRPGQHSSDSQMTLRTPVICIPVIAPVNAECSKTLSDSLFQNTHAENLKYMAPKDNAKDEVQFAAGRIFENAQVFPKISKDPLNQAQAKVVNCVATQRSIQSMPGQNMHQRYQQNSFSDKRNRFERRK